MSETIPDHAVTAPKVTFTYRNHKGEVSDREVLVTSIDYFYKLNEHYGYQPGWFLTGWDLDKNAVRSFSLNNIILPSGLNVYRLLMSISA